MNCCGQTTILFGKNKICESEKQKLLGILIDQSVRFDEYILQMAKKLAEI